MVFLITFGLGRLAVQGFQHSDVRQTLNLKCAVASLGQPLLCRKALMFGNALGCWP